MFASALIRVRLPATSVYQLFIEERRLTAYPT